MRTVILKFGGTSVASPTTIRRILEITSDQTRYPAGCIKGVVFSAFQGVTDTLITLANQATDKTSNYPSLFSSAIEQRHLDAIHELIPAERRGRVLAEASALIHQLQDILHGIALIGECSPRTLDQVTSFGERLSSFIIAHAYEAIGIPTTLIDTASLIKTTSSFGNAVPDKAVSFPLIQNRFNEVQDLAIIPGFIGSDTTESITTLGRGGSDLTASFIGAALNVAHIEIWTDVDGILTADPRTVTQAFPLSEITFEEAMELSHFGAKVLYPPTIQPAIEACIPITIKNTFNPTAQGTRIVTQRAFSSQPITGISSIDCVALIRLQGSGMIGVTGIASRFFKALSLAETNVILITQASSEHTICCAISPHHTARAQIAVHQEFELEISTGRIQPLAIEENLSIISVVGESMRNTPGVSGRIFQALGDNGINVVAIAQGSSERSISAVVSTTDSSKSLNALHEEFFLSDTKSVRLWVAGTGLIGKTLLEQIHLQSETLLHNYGLNIQVYGISNSRTMICSNEPLTDFCNDAGDSKDQIPSDLSTFVSHCIEANLQNSIFVDCTASEAPPKHYPSLLRKSIAVVTPNKRAFSGEQAYYEELSTLAGARRAPLHYETCVGAALPVLGTLNDLVQSGDTVHRIEAVLSGTLSYIFNTMRLENASFSEAVVTTKNKGFTEPDPREDLSGLDVARKVVILARNAGMKIELADIEMSPLLPPSSSEYTLEEFMKNISSYDSIFSSKLSQAAQEHRSLFFGATIDCQAKSITVGLIAVDRNHPFCSLSGADNIIAFTTERYKEQPLVIKGPGAGAQVTAAGVFADIIRAVR